MPSLKSNRLDFRKDVLFMVTRSLAVEQVHTKMIQCPRTRNLNTSILIFLLLYQPIWNGFNKAFGTVQLHCQHCRMHNKFSIHRHMRRPTKHSPIVFFLYRITHTTKLIWSIMYLNIPWIRTNSIIIGMRNSFTCRTIRWLTSSMLHRIIRSPVSIFHSIHIGLCEAALRPSRVYVFWTVHCDRSME